MCSPLFLTVAGICLLSVGTCVGFLTAALFAAGAAERNASDEIRSSPVAPCGQIISTAPRPATANDGQGLATRTGLSGAHDRSDYQKI
jgi:hypothetical protein